MIAASSIALKVNMVWSEIRTDDAGTGMMLVFSSSWARGDAGVALGLEVHWRCADGGIPLIGAGASAGTSAS